MIKKIAVVLLLITLQNVLGESPKTIRKCANQFTKHLYTTSIQNRTTDDNKNMCLSGFGAYLPMIMLYNGADGHTEEQMQSGLFLKNYSRDSINTNQKKLMDEMMLKSKSKLILTNKIYFDQSVIPKFEYKKNIESNYKTVIENVNFGASVEASKIINKWISEATNSSINQMFNSDDFGSDTKIVLVNAIQFKSKWLYPFDPVATSMQPFTCRNGITKNVPTMNRRLLCEVGPIPDLNASFITLPLEDEDTKMLIIFPNDPSGFNYIIQNFNRVKISKIMKDSLTQKSTIDLSMPKFKIETEINLEESLKKLGMTDMFSNSANFSSMCKEQVCVEKVKQKIIVDVNEIGCSASGVTTVSMKARSMGRKVRIKHSFIGFIIKNDVIIFVFDIADPSQK